MIKDLLENDYKELKEKINSNEILKIGIKVGLVVLGFYIVSKTIKSLTQTPEGINLVATLITRTL